MHRLLPARGDRTTPRPAVGRVVGRSRRTRRKRVSPHGVLATQISPPVGGASTFDSQWRTARGLSRPVPDGLRLLRRVRRSRYDFEQPPRRLHRLPRLRGHWPRRPRAGQDCRRGSPTEPLARGGVRIVRSRFQASPRFAWPAPCAAGSESSGKAAATVQSARSFALMPRPPHATWSGRESSKCRQKASRRRGPPAPVAIGIWPTSGTGTARTPSVPSPSAVESRWCRDAHAHGASKSAGSAWTCGSIRSRGTLSESWSCANQTPHLAV